MLPFELTCVIFVLPGEFIQWRSIERGDVSRSSFGKSNDCSIAPKGLNLPPIDFPFSLEDGMQRLVFLDSKARTFPFTPSCIDTMIERCFQQVCLPNVSISLTFSNLLPRHQASNSQTYNAPVEVILSPP
jgi:hypothetical protein